MRRNCNARAATVAGGLMPRKLATARGLEPWLLPQESGFSYKFAVPSRCSVAGGCSCRLERDAVLNYFGKKRNKILVSPKSDIAPSQKTLLENAAKRLQLTAP